MKQIKCDLIFSVFGAIVLTMLDKVFCIAPYVIFDDLEVLCFLLGLLTCIIIFSFRVERIVDLLVRFICLILFYVILLALEGYIGIMPFVDNLLNINRYDPTDNAAGLLMFLLGFIRLGLIMIVIIVNALLIIKKKNK